MNAPEVKPAPTYNPTAQVFEALRAADRPIDIHQLAKALPKLPFGTLSGCLNRLKEAGVVERNVGTRPALWRSIKRDLPAELQESRYASPLARRQSQAATKAKIKELLIVVPLGKRNSETLTESEARALLASLKRVFGE